MAALDIPLVPVNSDAKTFAAQSLMQAINNMHLAQSAGGAGGGGGAANTQQKQADEKAKQDAWRDEMADREAKASGGTTAAPASVAPSGQSGLQFQESGGSPGTGGSSLGFGSEIPVMGMY